MRAREKAVRLEDVLNEECVFPDLKAGEKREVLDEMVTGLAHAVPELNREKVLELLLEREQLGSTGIGYGVAIPHTRVAGLDRIIVSFARSKRGVDFQSLDEAPVHIFFLIVAPESSPAANLKVLANITRLLKGSGFRQSLLSVSTARELYRIIVDEANKY